MYSSGPALIWISSPVGSTPSVTGWEGSGKSTTPDSWATNSSAATPLIRLVHPMAASGGIDSRCEANSSRLPYFASIAR